MRSSETPPRPRLSYLQAWDPVAQKEVWRALQPDPSQTSGILTTGGDLVFMGNAAGEFVAYHAKSGERLWSHITQAAVVAAPSTYMIDGQQYLALLVGSRGLPEAGPGAVGATTDKSTNNSRLLVYKLGGTTTLPDKVIEVKTASEGSDRPAPPAVTASNETIAHGEQVYGRYCSVCHGPTAVSPDVGTFPDLRHSPRIASSEAWASVVMKGELANKGMVSFAPSISDSDAQAIRHYVISRSNQEQ